MADPKFGAPAIYKAVLPVLADGQQTALMTDDHGRLIVAADVTVGLEVGGTYNATPPTLVDGQEAPFQLDSSGRLLVNLAASSYTTDSIAAVGDVASGTADSGNPVKIGGVGNSAVPSAVTAGQRVNAMFDLNGRQVTSGSALSGDSVSGIRYMPLAGSDGSNVQPLKTTVGSLNTTAGVLASAIVAQVDDVAPQVVSENSFGNVRMTTARALMTEQVYTYSRVTADAQVKSSAGFIHTITIAATGTVTAGVLTVYDSTAESGTVIFSVALPVTTFTPIDLTLDVNTTTGIYVGYDATLANVQATLSFR